MSTHPFFQRGDGRWCVICRGNGYYLWYRVVMWNEIGRELGRSEIVHHLNSDCSDDRLENLEITNQRDHTASHYERGQKHRFTDQDRARSAAKTRTRVVIGCDQCGGSFEIHPYRLKNARTHACSRDCANQLKRKHAATDASITQTGFRRG